MIEIATGVMYSSSTELAERAGDIIMQLQEQGSLSEIAQAIVKDCKRSKNNTVYVNVLLTNRCRCNKVPGILIYWKVRSKFH